MHQEGLQDQVTMTGIDASLPVCQPQAFASSSCRSLSSGGVLSPEAKMHRGQETQAGRGFTRDSAERAGALFTHRAVAVHESDDWDDRKT